MKTLSAAILLLVGLSVAPATAQTTLPSPKFATITVGGSTITGVGTAPGNVVSTADPRLGTAMLGTNNLSDLTNTAAARGNLGLAPVAASGSASDLGAGTLPAARLPALTGDVTTAPGTAATTLTLSGATAGTYGNSTTIPIFTVDAKGRVTSAAATPISSSVGGTVTSVAVAVPGDETVSGSPVTSTGTITISRTAQPANAVLVGPASGTAAVPAYRALGTTDLPLTALTRNGLKNRLVNGAMGIDQRNNGAAVTLGTATAYTVDRWFGWTGTSPASETAQRVAVLSGGVAYAERLARASGATATAAINLGQVLESVPNIDLQGQAVTLSLKARAGANFSGAGLACTVATGTGTDQTSALFAAGASSGWTGYAVAGSATFAPTTAFQTFALTATIPAGATQVGVSCGYTPTGTAGAADNVDIGDVQLEVGSFAAAQVTFERRPQATETALAQRYYEIVSSGYYAYTATGYTSAVIPFKSTMRAAPAIAYVANGSTYSGAASGLSFFGIDTNSATAQFNFGAAGSYYNYGFTVSANAEL